MSRLNDLEKEKRIRELWKQAFKKAKAASILNMQLQQVRSKIALFGRQLLSRKPQDLAEKEEDEEDEDDVEILCPCVIMPDQKFKVFWNIVIIILLLYTATVVPYRISFYDEASTGFLAFFEIMVDVLFGLDIIVNFCSAIELPNGKVEARCKPIAKSYIRSWFLMDLFATFPT